VQGRERTPYVIFQNTQLRNWAPLVSLFLGGREGKVGVGMRGGGEGCLGAHFRVRVVGKGYYYKHSLCTKSCILNIAIMPR